MSDLNENKPRRRRVVRGGDALMATSNETKMKGKARAAEKNTTPLFSTVKAASTETNNDLMAKTPETEEVIQFANPLPLNEKPKQTRGRKPKVQPASEPVKATETVIEPAESMASPEPPKKRRGRPKKQVVLQEEQPVETLVEELMPQTQRASQPEFPLFSDDEIFSDDNLYVEEALPIVDLDKAVSPAQNETVEEEKTESKPRRGRPKKKKSDNTVDEPVKSEEEQKQESKSKGKKKENPVDYPTEPESVESKVEEAPVPYLANAQYDGSVMAEGVLEITSENCGFLRSSDYKRLVTQ